MDSISVIGLIVGVFSIVLGQVLEGGHIDSLVQPTAFFIVVGGTLGAVMLQSPMSVFLAGIRMTGWIFFPPVLSKKRLIDQMAQWSQIARKEGLLALEAQVTLLQDPFMAKGLQLLVDGAEPERLRDVLEVEIDSYETQMKLGARTW